MSLLIDITKEPPTTDQIIAEQKRHLFIARLSLSLAFCLLCAMFTLVFFRLYGLAFACFGMFSYCVCRFWRSEYQSNFAAISADDCLILSQWVKKNLHIQAYCKAVAGTHKREIINMEYQQIKVFLCATQEQESKDKFYLDLQRQPSPSHHYSIAP